VEFCNRCSGLFLDRGELYEMFRSEGYQCPPEALLRLSFSPLAGEPLQCPKCMKETLEPGTIQGSEVWHCTPCNGFLVNRGLLMGEAKAEHVPLDLQGFTRMAGEADAADAVRATTLGRMLDRLAFWTQGSP
jgi:Zn-finger nucleic acid-binding protein